MGVPEAERGYASAAEVALPLSIITILLVVFISTPQPLHPLSEPTGILTCDGTVDVAEDEYIQLRSWLRRKVPHDCYGCTWRIGQSLRNLHSIGSDRGAPIQAACRRPPAWQYNDFVPQSWT